MVVIEEPERGEPLAPGALCDVPQYFISYAFFWQRASFKITISSTIADRLLRLGGRSVKSNIFSGLLIKEIE